MCKEKAFVEFMFSPKYGNLITALQIPETGQIGEAPKGLYFIARGKVCVFPFWYLYLPLPFLPPH